MLILSDTYIQLYIFRVKIRGSVNRLLPSWCGQSLSEKIQGEWTVLVNLDILSAISLIPGVVRLILRTLVPAVCCIIPGKHCTVADRMEFSYETCDNPRS
jgi:hypothetical protein